MQWLGLCTSFYLCRLRGIQHRHVVNGIESRNHQEQAGTNNLLLFVCATNRAQESVSQLLFVRYSPLIPVHFLSVKLANSAPSLSHTPCRMQPTNSRTSSSPSTGHILRTQETYSTLSTSSISEWSFSAAYNSAELLRRRSRFPPAAAAAAIRLRTWRRRRSL
jgi:hypothetical protein